MCGSIPCLALRVDVVWGVAGVSLVSPRRGNRVIRSTGWRKLMPHNERMRHRSPIVADVPTGRATDTNLLVVCRENRAPPTLYAGLVRWVSRTSGVSFFHPTLVT